MSDVKSPSQSPDLAEYYIYIIVFKRPKPSKKKKKRSAEEAEEAKAEKQRRLEEARAAAEERKKSKIEVSLIEKAELEDAITNKLLIVGKTVKIPVRSAHRDAAEM